MQKAVAFPSAQGNTVCSFGLLIKSAPKASISLALKFEVLHPDFPSSSLFLHFYVQKNHLGHLKIQIPRTHRESNWIGL